MSKVVVTGGSSGIGLEVCKLLAAQGHQVFSFDLADPAKKNGGISAINVDITDSRALKKALEAVGSGVDWLVNNAGVIRRGDLLASSEADFDLLFRVNVKGSWLMIRELIPYFSPGATILQVCSDYANGAPKDPGIYAWTKQSLAALVENLETHYPEYVVKAAFPGPVDTPLARYGVTGKDLEDKIKIMHRADYVAQKIVELLEGPYTRLLFDAEIWDYKLKDICCI